MEFTMFETHRYDSTFTPRDDAADATAETVDETGTHDEHGGGSSP